MFLTRRYAWSLDQLVSGQLLLRNSDCMARHSSTVTSIALTYTFETYSVFARLLVAAVSSY